MVKKLINNIINDLEQRYANGGGVGSMMQPRMNFAGGGGDFIGLNPNGPITIEDLTQTDNNGNFLISAAEALPDQSGIINAGIDIMSPGVNTIEGSLIDGDDITSRYGVQKDFDSLPPSYNDSRIVSEELGITGYDKPNMRSVAGDDLPSGIPSNYNQATVDDYQDMIMNPDGFPNALQNLERFQDNRFSDLDFQPGYDFIDAPNETNTLSDLYQNRNYIDNPRTGFFDNTIMSKGNPDASLVNKTKEKISSIRDFLPFGDKSLSGMVVKGLKSIGNKFNDPNAPSYKTYSPNIDYSKLNTNNLNDFYDSNEESDTYGTTRFDRAKTAFGKSRTLQEYFERVKAARAQKQQAAQEAREQATADRARAANASVYASADRQGFTNAQGGFSTSAADAAGTSAGSGQGFSNNSGRGRTGYQGGGIVSLRK